MTELLMTLFRTLIVAVIVAAALFGSWIITCGIVYMISEMLKYEYNRALATALWVVMAALVGFSRWE